MKKLNIFLSQYSFSCSPEIVNGVKFTRRELDVIACMLSGRAAKTIGSFLSISRKTVDTHMHNVMLKLECHSREGVREFIEKSGKFSDVKLHYSNLLADALFKRKLHEISACMGKNKPTCLIIYSRDQENKAPFLHNLVNHLKLVGIKTSLETKESQQSITRLIHRMDSQPIDYLLYVVSSPLTRRLQACDSKAKLEASHLTQKAAQSPGRIVFLLHALATEIAGIIPEKSRVGFGERQNYYFSVFEILKKLSPDIDFDKIIAEFKNQYGDVYGSPHPVFPCPETQSRASLQEGIANSVPSNILKKWKRLLFLCGFLCLVCGGILLLRLNTDDGPFHEDHRIEGAPPIRSDLSIPAGNVFLKRPALIAQIREQLKGQQDVQTLALIGIGGSGKTTLARRYAHEQTSSIVWEINAETEENLTNSVTTHQNQ